MDLRSPASACREVEGSPFADAASHSRGEAEERQNRCEQDRRLSSLRLPARVPHGINRKPRPPSHPALSCTAEGLSATTKLLRSDDNNDAFETHLARSSRVV